MNASGPKILQAKRTTRKHFTNKHIAKFKITKEQPKRDFITL